MDLYGSGSNAHSQFPYLDDAANSNPYPQTIKLHKPSRFLRGETIKVLWTSWCDSIITCTDDDNPIPTLHYTGVGLNQEQVANIKESATENDFFFGAKLEDGVKGFIQANGVEPASATFFTARDGKREAASSIEKFRIRRDFLVKLVSVTSGGHVYVAGTKGATNPECEEKSCILQFPSLLALKTWLANKSPTPNPIITLPTHETWTQLDSNATTTTGLTSTGRVYTWTTDPRYSRCLGREAGPDAPTPIPCPVPYLSETEITKIASGGYMTAALSSDGELFLWGQACPGVEGELRVLKGEPARKETKEDSLRGADSNIELSGRVEEESEEQDEFVKCVTIKIQSEPACVTDMAVGHGHVLLAAEIKSGRYSKRKVFAAGQGESGQLGVQEAQTFVEEFTEIRDLGDQKVMGLAAAGWSSWVLLERK
jgi:hypothetical protein